jgi:hypothetical protein
MVQPSVIFINGHHASSSVASPRRELPDAAMCHPFLLRTSARVLRPKPINPPLMVLRPKPPNTLVSSVLHTRPPLLDTCHYCPRPTDRQVLWAPSTCTSFVLTRSIRSLPCTLARVDVPDVSHRGWLPDLWSLGPSLTFALHRSQSIGTARPYSTFTSSSTTASKLYTCIIQAKRHVALLNSRRG